VGLVGRKDLLRVRAGRLRDERERTAYFRWRGTRRHPADTK